MSDESSAQHEPASPQTPPPQTAPPPRRRRLGSILIGLRGVFLLLLGLYAVFFPLPALAVLVVFGGAVFLVDGILGLWAITFGGARTGNFWFDVVRNVLSIVTGVLVLFAPFIATVVASTFIVYLVAFQCILVGVMEIVIIVRERELYARIWPVLLSGVAYVLFGIVLLFVPLLAATVFMVLGGALAVIFAIGLLVLAWRLYKKGF